MKLPEIDLKELEKIKQQNFRERLEFQDRYVRWLKATGNIKWSSAQSAIINRKSASPDNYRGRAGTLKTRHARHHAAKSRHRL